MHDNWLELAIIAFILIGMAVAIWRGGAANPEPTGRLHRRIQGLDGDMRAIDGKVGQLAVEVHDIRNRVEDIDKRTAKASDIRRLEGALSKLEAEMTTTRETVASLSADSRHTRQQVDRLYDFLVKKGIGA